LSDQPRITIRENGSYRVEGGVPLFDHLGNQLVPANPAGYSLCRCGASKNKPFCDKSHAEVGFDGTCTWRPKEAAPGS
jgi:CDGSH-type Zn-finger protein